MPIGNLVETADIRGLSNKRIGEIQWKLYTAKKLGMDTKTTFPKKVGVTALESKLDAYIKAHKK